MKFLVVCSFEDYRVHVPVGSGTNEFLPSIVSGEILSSYYCEGLSGTTPGAPRLLRDG